MKQTAADVIGVYTTIHADSGDYDTQCPEYIKVDCELITFHFMVPASPFTGTMHSSTLHFGTLNVTNLINPPTFVRVGDRFTVVQGVVLGELVPTRKPVPAWAR